MILRPAPEGELKEAPLSMLAPLWALAGANIYFGLNTQLTVNLAERAAAALIGGGP